MMCADSMRNLKALIDHAGIGQSGNDQETLMELMNLTLQCLGGIRIMVDAAEREKNCAAAAAEFYPGKSDLNSDDALRLVFAGAVDRMMFSISKAAPLNDLDPSRHLVESFPHDQKIGSSHWLPIHWAVLGDDMYDVEGADAVVLQSNKSPPRNDNAGSCKYSHRISLINTIVKSYPSVANQLDREGRSILHYAARLSSVALVDCVMKFAVLPGGFGPAHTNLNGAFPLHNTARFSKSLSVMQYLLKIHPDLVTVGNNDGTLPLHWAAAKNSNLEIVRCLIDAFPQALQIANHEGYLPLHTAGQNLRLDIVKAISDANPSAISVLDTEGGIPLHHACCFNTNIEVIRFMNTVFKDGMTLAQSDGITPLHLAASQNSSTDVIKYLLQIYPQAAFAADVDGWLPLHCLVTRHRDEMTSDRIECMRLLLSANPKAVSSMRNDGQTPYDMAKSNQHRDLVLRLILFAQPDYNKAEFARLNWSGYRRLTVISCLALHRYSNLSNNGHFDYLCLESDPASVVGLEALQKSFMYVVKKLTYGYLGNSGRSIKSNVLRHIIKFL
jgi:ankyrin repeat protein